VNVITTETTTTQVNVITTKTMMDRHRLVGNADSLVNSLLTHNHILTTLEGGEVGVLRSLLAADAAEEEQAQQTVADEQTRDDSQESKQSKEPLL